MTIVDYGIYGGSNEFDLATSPEKPIVLLGGLNGAGKTTLFESILLCFYGIDAMETRMAKRQYHQKILKAMHRTKNASRIANKSSITLDFQYARAGKIVSYRISRTWQNSNGKIDELLELFTKDMDGKFIEMDTVEDPQHIIDRMLPRGVTRLFFFDGEKIQKMAESTNDEQYMATSFNSLLGLDIVEQLHDDIGIYATRNTDGNSAFLIKELENDIAERSAIEEKLERNRQKQAFLQGEIDQANRKLSDKENNFKMLGGDFAIKRQELMSKKAKLESNIEQIKLSMRDICSDSLPFCLIPNIIDKLHIKLTNDLDELHKRIKRDVLKSEFEQVVIEIEKSLLTYEKNTRESMMSKTKEIMNERIQKLSTKHVETIDFKLEDLEYMIRLIDDVSKFDKKDFEGMAKDYDEVSSKLDKINEMLAVAPNQDEIGPLFSDIALAGKEIGELKHEMETLKNVEAQSRSHLAIINVKIRKQLVQKKANTKVKGGLVLAPRVQKVLMEYYNELRLKKVALLESNIINGIHRLFHKSELLDKITIDPNTFSVTLYGKDKKEITRDMLSTGEQQMYATAVIWGLARTSGTPLPFIIDTPLARLDNTHRQELVENFYPTASHQMILLSTNSEIVDSYYDKLAPYISHSAVLKHDESQGKTIQRKGYFGVN